jgi:hypothetical protein
MLHSSANCRLFTITGLANNKGIEVTSPINVEVRPIGGSYGFLAEFREAGISVQGETEETAVERIREIILEWFEDMCRVQFDKLSPDTRKALQVLRSHLIRSAIPQYP